MVREYRDIRWKGRIMSVTLPAWLIVLLIVNTSFGKDDAYAEIDRGMDRFNVIYRHVVEGYYKEIAPGDLIEAGIRGMESQLDPYTQFLGEKAAEQLRIDTMGKFGGIGITIILKDRAPTVVSVIRSTPADRAGLFAGDRIIRIEGDPTEGKGLDEVVSRLRGEPGTAVRITVEREGEPRPLEFSLVREDIELPNVAFADTIEGGIGYLSMARTRFSDRTDKDVEEALTSLRAKGARGIVLDLRGNPGGLLPQAIKVTNKFLDRGKLIVSTKGRTRDQNREYVASEEPVVRDLPLVILVDGGSASASEIVAGAIQDSDRGLIMGTNTFGKGSVQTVLDVDEETKLKLTTALYYTPSGRSIHKPSNGRDADISVMIGGRSLSLFDVLGTIRGAG
ncbi:MAG: S41 family peptidase, partial [Candidatus Latescibacteria bacterium]|nr:S41 family peptidase [Candidatus Latescibacterota bacterium]